MARHVGSGRVLGPWRGQAGDEDISCPDVPAGPAAGGRESGRSQDAMGLHQAAKDVTIVGGLAVWADGEETAGKQHPLENEVCV